MALKKPYRPMEAFSMSSMTDVIFLLLIFFMVTSTIIFPSAIDVNLPQSSEQTTLKPVTEVYVDSAANYYLVEDRNSDDIALAREHQVDADELFASLKRIQAQDSLRSIALYADEHVDYGRVIEILDLAARNRLRLVLATRAASRHASGADIPDPLQP